MQPIPTRAQIARAWLKHAHSFDRCGRPVRFPKPQCKHLKLNLAILTTDKKKSVICIEQTSIYICTFPNALTSKKAKNHEIGIYFSTNAIVALCHAPP